MNTHACVYILVQIPVSTTFVITRAKSWKFDLYLFKNYALLSLC